MFNPYFLFQHNQGGKLIIVLFGESNSGGIAPNSSATSLEMSARNIKILNNNTLEFENLQLGVNNLIGHIGLESYWYDSHGMENQLANLYDAGFFGGKEVYIVKAGRGGSKVSDWVQGSQAYNNLQTRLNTAIELVFGNEIPNIKFMLTLGINDYLAGTSPSDYKSGVENLLSNVKEDYPHNFNLRLMKFDFVTSSASNAYSNQILQIPNDISGVTVFNTVGCSVLPDGNHLDYLGMKSATNKFLD